MVEIVADISMGTVPDLDAWVRELMLDFDIRSKFQANKDVLRVYCEQYLKSPEIFEIQNEKFAKKREDEITIVGGVEIKNAVE